MTVEAWVQIAVFIAVLTALTPVLGAYLARVFRGEGTVLDPILLPAERFILRVLRVDPREEQDWRAYAVVIVFSALCFGRST